MRARFGRPELVAIDHLSTIIQHSARSIEKLQDDPLGSTQRLLLGLQGAEMHVGYAILVVLSDLGESRYEWEVLPLGARAFAGHQVRLASKLVVAHLSSGKSLIDRKVLERVIDLDHSGGTRKTTEGLAWLTSAHLALAIETSELRSFWTTGPRQVLWNHSSPVRIWQSKDFYFLVHFTDRLDESESSRMICIRSSSRGAEELGASILSVASLIASPNAECIGIEPLRVPWQDRSAARRTAIVRIDR